MIRYFKKKIKIQFFNISSGTLIVLVDQLSILISLPFITSSLGFEAFGILTQGLIIYQIGSICMDFGCNYSLVIGYVSWMVNWFVNGPRRLTNDTEVVCNSCLFWF